MGGYGFTEWKAPAEEWLPGTYEVQIFVGLDWKVVGQFILQGDAPTPSPHRHSDALSVTNRDTG